MNLRNQLLLAVLACSLVFSACNKMQESPASVSTTKTTTTAEELVLTPGGLFPKSHVHLIENGYTVLRKGGHFFKMEKNSGNIIQDYGEIPSSPGSAIRRNMIADYTRKAVIPNAAIPSGGNPAWVTYAYWSNKSTTPISSFLTNWKVPNIPGNITDGQTLFLFNGTEDAAGATVVQPVLQWGSSNAGTPDNNGWGIANWYVENGTWFFSPLLDVAVGTYLQGVITYTGQQPDGSYNYTSSFNNASNGTAYGNPLTIIEGQEPNLVTPIPFVPLQDFTFETLEAYHNSGAANGVVQASDYPSGQNYLDMNNILLYVGGIKVIPTWTADNNNVPNGETINITPPVDNYSNGPGAVFIYWHPVPTIDGASLARFTTTSTAYTINAYPGSLVNILLTGYARRPGLNGAYGTTTSTLTITTSGVTFTGGSASVSATNSTNTYTLTVPSSGSVTLNGYYTSNETMPPAIISALASLY